MRPALVLTFLLSALLISGEAAAGKTSYSSSTITYNGVKYSYSSSSTCTGGTAALRYNRKWWCPVVTTTASTSTSTSTATSTPTSTTSTTTTTTTAPATYNAKLSWTIPTTRADGTPLTASELAGYEVYYTNDTGSVAAVVPVSSGSAISTTVSSLASGNYSFSISAIDTSGLKSALSTVAIINFP